MNKNFSDLKVGDRFFLNGTEYVKTEDVRVSCCRSINCQASNDPNAKNYVQPNTQVTVNG